MLYSPNVNTLNICTENTQQKLTSLQKPCPYQGILSNVFLPINSQLPCVCSTCLNTKNFWQYTQKDLKPSPQQNSTTLKGDDNN